MKSITLLLVVACVLFVSSLQGELHAYLDPGTGSIAIQMVLAGIVAGLAALKVYWYKVRSFVSRRQVRGDSSLLD